MQNKLFDFIESSEIFSSILLKMTYTVKTVTHGQPVENINHPKKGNGTVIIFELLKLKMFVRQYKH